MKLNNPLLPLLAPCLLFTTQVSSSSSEQVSLDSEPDPIPLSIRSKYMHAAIQSLYSLRSPCPFEAFGAVIVNHTASIDGDIVCIGVNGVRSEGNPTLHGEIAAINNCTTILTSPSGPYKLSASETLNAFSQLSLYTTAEACAMCATAIRYGMFAEYIYGTSSDTLLALGWPQLEITSREVFRRSSGLRRGTRLVGDVLREETDKLFGWQYQDGKCPVGCGRAGEGDGEGECEVIEGRHDEL